MVVRIRFSKIGIKKYPFYHVVVANAQSRRDGMPIEFLGKYFINPDDSGKIKVQLDFDRVNYWLAVGAQPSDTVRVLLGKVLKLYMILQAGILPILPERTSNIKTEVIKRQFSTNKLK